MNTDEDILAMPALQRDTGGLLEYIKYMLTEYGGDAQQDCIEQLAHQQRLVENLSLRVTVVAPMKAGKSTLINAISGQELMPSHSMAMTSLPTELVFNSAQQAPTLSMSADLRREMMEKSLQPLQTWLQNTGLDQAQEQAAAAKLPHINELLEKLHNGLTLEETSEGQNKVVECLEDINHLIRLQSTLFNDAKLPEIHELPRVTAPLHPLYSEDWPQDSNLVLIDTPGPNEAAGESLKLTGIVTEQLKKSSIVFVVLNYTQLNTQADAAVKQEVDKIIELRGKENLFVVVNKIDQRGPNTMTTEQVKKYVAAEFGITDPQRIFETSANKAFTASYFQKQLKDCNYSNEVLNHTAAENLLRLAYPDTWETEKNRLDTDDLDKLAQKLWANSGVEQIIQQAIRPLMQEGEHLCLRTALKTGKQCLGDFQERQYHNGSTVYPQQPR